MPPKNTRHPEHTGDEPAPRPAFFFDRDGIVNRRLPGDYVRSPQEFEFLDGFWPLLSWARQRDYLTIVITNQQGIGKGLMSENDLHHVHHYMQEFIAQRSGKPFDDIYYCPDLAGTIPNCRKPSPAMLLEAGQKWNIDMANSWMIGDSLSDAQAGRAAGAQTILIGEFGDNRNVEADVVFPSLQSAALWLANLRD